MKTRRSIPALGAFFVLVALMISGCGSSGVPDGSVAVVAGNSITTRAVHHWMYVAAKEQAQGAVGQPIIVPSDPPGFAKCIATARAEIPALRSTSAKQLRTDCKRLFTSLSSQVMDFLIKAYWYQADAHRYGIKISNAQVQAALAKVRAGQFSTQAQFNQFLASTGQTLADVTYRVRIQQIYFKLLARYPATVTPAQVAAYYQSHQSQFGTPERRDLKIVLAKNQASAQAALAALKSGQSWAAVAKRYSIDPTTKNKGGVLAGVSKGTQDAALTNTAFSLATNRIVGPIKGQFGYYVLEVTKITPAKLKSLAQSTALITQTLHSQLQTAAQTAIDAHAKKNWLTKTQCASVYAMADCNGYKASSSASAASSSPAPASAG